MGSGISLIRSQPKPPYGFHTTPRQTFAVRIKTAAPVLRLGIPLLGLSMDFFDKFLLHSIHDNSRCHPRHHREERCQPLTHERHKLTPVRSVPFASQALRFYPLITA